MGGGNGQKSRMAREKHLDKQKAAAKGPKLHREALNGHMNSYINLIPIQNTDCTLKFEIIHEVNHGAILDGKPHGIGGFKPDRLRQRSWFL